MFKKYPLLSRVFAFLFCPLITGLTFAYLQLDKSVPQYEGTFKVENLTDGAEIVFNQYGMPLVNASTDRDAYFIQGYLHARERLWQMELQRRLVQGKLSEIFGKDTVHTDIWMRTLGLYRAAANNKKTISAGALASLEAYKDGVNSWLKNTSALPPEFALFDLQPEPWKVADSLAWQKVFALNLGQNMFSELDRLLALKLLTSKQIKTFYQYDPEQYDLNSIVADKYSEDENPTPPNPLSLFNVDHSLGSNQNVNEIMQEDWSIGVKFSGSNAWVVSGLYTQSGQPILANDPHLGIQQPAIWYPMQLNGDKVHVSGMSMIGIPGIVLGRNRDIAWGATALTGDQQDLFVLEKSLQENNSYVTSNGNKHIEVREEIISIRAGTPIFLHKQIEPIKVRVRNTEIGPIVSDVLYETGMLLALRWSALEKWDKSFEAFFNLQYANNWQQFRAALKDLTAPGLHFVYSDTKGNIGSQVAGKLPDRGKGVGILPLSANDRANYWKGYVPFEELPSQFNPQSGIIVSANSKIESGSDIVISHEWAPDVRKKRIIELLRSKIKDKIPLSSQHMVDIQFDQVDLGAKQFLKVLNRPKLVSIILEQAKPELKMTVSRVLDKLATWNARFDQASSAATIYRYWVDMLKDSIFLNELNPSWNGEEKTHLTRSLLGLVNEVQLSNIINDHQNDWCSTSVANEILCQKELTSSFFKAIAQIKKDTRSDDIEDWAWGQLHHVEYSHKPLGSVKVLDKVFKNKVPTGGTLNSINVANSEKQDSGGYLQTFGVTFRQVFDLSNEKHSYYSLASGQSGHFLSPHYDNTLHDFIRGDMKKYYPTDITAGNLCDEGSSCVLVEDDESQLMHLVPLKY